MMELEAKNDVHPICPHCSTELRILWMQMISGLLGKRYVYFCPHCRKVLGISHRTRADLIKDGLTVLLTQFLDNGGIQSILLCFPLNIVQLADQGQHRLDDHAAPGKGH
jgi:hypothetical protein